jgi:hypothetical protein
MVTPRTRILHDSPHLEEMLASLDDALTVFADGNPDPLLALPAAISSLVEQLLAEGGKPITIRLELARLAVLSGYDWRGRLEASRASAETADDRLAALILLSTAHALRPDSPITQQFVSDELAESVTEPASPRILELAAECTTHLIDQGKTEAGEQLVSLVRGPHQGDSTQALIDRTNVATQRGTVGDVAGAVAELRKVIDDGIRLLGPDHPTTLGIRHNLAYWRGRAGDVAGAAAELDRLRQDYLRVLGPDHPETLIARHNLARWRGEAGDVSGAAAEFVYLLQDYLRVLGPDHPNTLIARHNLAHWRG